MTARLLGVWPDRSPEWHAARRNRIGGSDIGIIMGWGAYPYSNPKSRADLLAEKIAGQQAEPTQTPAEATKGARRRGVYLEPSVRAWLADREGVTYDEHRSSGTWVSTEHDWMLFNPDAVTADGRLAEFKTCDVRDTDHGWGRAGTNQVPLAYGAQVQWGLGILGCPEGLLAVLSGAPRFEFARYVIKFDQRIFDYLRTTADAFRAELETHTQRTAA